jgi:pectinesterase
LTAGWATTSPPPAGITWGKPEAEKTAFYAEFNSEGPGADSSARAPWGKHLTESEAKKFRPEAFLRGDDNWNPAAEHF